MKAAIIGGGFAGNIHADALRSCGIELSAVVSSHEESARAFAEKWKIPKWGTNPDLIFDSDIDAVHICTPPVFHGFYAAEALKAGKHVFCEKPLCFDPEEARKLAGLAERSGSRCTVTYNVRYHMAVQKARTLIRSGCFGRPLLVHGNYLQEFHALPAPFDWRYDPSLSGSMRAVTEIGSHWIDTAQYITGKKVEAVSALFGNFFPERYLDDGMMTLQGSSEQPDEKRIRVKSEDAACILLRFGDGVIGNVTLSEISPGRGNYLSLEITCENGNLWWNEEENNFLHTAVKGEGVRTEVFAFGNGFNDTFLSLIRSFYEGQEVPTVREAAQIVDVCSAISKSAYKDSVWERV